MANRYWIGGTGDWTDTAHWSDAQNGVGGFSVPTQADNVFFTSNSGTGTITVNAIASMLDFDVTGLAQNITLANAAYAFNVYGSLALSTKLATSFTGTGYLYLKATSTGKTITSNGNTSGWNRLYFDGVGGTWTNQDDWNSVTSTNLTNGTWNQSIYNISNRAFGYGVGTAILTMTSGTFLTTEGCYFHINSGGKTFNCGTGKIKNISTTGGGNLYVGTNTFYDVEAYCISSGGGSGLCTFRNLTVTHNGVNGFIALNEGLPSWVINGTFTVSGYNAAERRISVPGLIGTQRTITVNGSIIASNVDFRDIKGAGTANWDLSGIDGGSGDCGGNSGIIFTPSQTLYFKHTSGAVNLSDSSKWFTTDGGSTLGRTPLPQDYAYFTANSFAGTSTITFNMPRFCGFDMSGVNQAVTLSQNITIEFYGDYILGNNIITSLVYPSSVNLFGKSGVECKFNSYAKSLGASGIIIYRNIYRNYSDINMGTANTSQFYLGNAVFYLNGYNLSSYSYNHINNISGYYGGYFYAGSGTITINVGMLDIYRTRFIAETSTIVMNNSGTPDINISIGSIFGSLVTINKLILQGTITGNYIIGQGNGSTTINELTINAGKKVKFEGGRTFSIGKLTANGTSGNLISIGSTTTTKANITYTGGIQPNIKFADISYINATNAFKVRASIDSGNNTNITFNTAKFWVGGTGNINDISHWSNSSGGAGGAVLPTLNDDVFFDENSLGADSQTITINAAFDCLSLDFEYLVNTMTLTNAVYNLSIYGGLFLSTKLTTNFTSTGYLYLKATTSVGIYANGTTKNWNRIYFDGVGGTWTNQDDWNADTSAMYHVNGTWNTNNFTFKTTLDYILQNGVSYGKTLTLNSSYFYVRDFHDGSGSPWGQFSINAGTSNIYCSRNFKASTSPRNFYDVYADGFDGFNCHTYNNLTIVASSLTSFAEFRLFSVGITVNGTLTLKGYNSTNRRTFIYNYVFGTQNNMNLSNAVFENVDFRDIKGAGTANWDLSGIDGGSGDCGGNSGIIFTPAQPQWYKHTSGDCSWSDSTKWFSDQAKTIAGRVPLPQDDATFDATSFTGVSTLNVNCTRIGRSLNMEGVNQDVTFSLAKAIECYGSFVLGNNITCYGGFSKNLLGIGDFVINTFNKNIPSNFTIYRGNYTANSNITLIGEAGNQMLINGGNFNLNGFNLSCILFSTVTSGTVNLGSGTINLVSGNPVWSSYTSISSNTNLIATNSTISLQTNSNPTNDNPRIDALNKVFGKVIIGGNTTKAQQIVQSCTINELIINEGKKLNISAGKTVSIGNLTAIGTSINPITIGSTTTGSTFTLNKTQPLNEKIECDYLILQDSKVQPAKTWYAGKNSVNNGNNTGWDFDVFHSRDIILQPNKRILVDSNGRIVW